MLPPHGIWVIAAKHSRVEIVKLLQVEAAEQHGEERAESRQERGEGADEVAEDHEAGDGEGREDDDEGDGEVLEVLARHAQRLGELADVLVEAQQAQKLDVDEKDDGADKFRQLLVILSQTAIVDVAVWKQTAETRSIKRTHSDS